MVAERSAQGALEYLLLIGGGLIVTAVVVGIALTVMGSGSDIGHSAAEGSTSILQQGLDQIDGDPDSPSSYTHPDLVAYWKFDEGSGATAADSAGSHQGTLQGSTTWVSGKRGQGLYFDGSGDYVSTALWVPQENSSREATYAAWVYPESTSSGKHQVISSDYWGHDWSLLRIGAAWWVFSGDNEYNTLIPVVTNKWQFIAVTFSSSGFVFYKDGSSHSYSLPTIGYDSTTRQVRIGMNPIASSGYYEYFDGIIDEAMVFDKELTPAEIQDIYDQTS